MAKKYDVVRHNEHTITLKLSGVRLLGSEVTIQRASIASTTRKLGMITVVTSSGQRFDVYPGVRDAQKKLVAEAFGLSL